ncbi:hypothetical protein QBC46DRAFT_389708 [Diplogelasinospora grovesii]|uniref:Uncharacterized protein n=1 Tax=Diplogelasinospora grovesii TaxID=303347 RepID=A0AAN6N3Q9_9PEZI|nr:hypothetical protein QBC46DRAFT_389708 [Diplogelasinospora grovesii]
MVRRPEFPSWSWLGWKPSPAKPRPDESGSESCFRVIAVHSDREDYVPIMRDDCSIAAILEFEGSGGSRHNWDKDTMDRLGEHTVAAAGKPPGFLILTGWAFEVTVERGAAGETMWKFDHGLGLVNGLPLPGAVEDAAGPEHPSGQKLWGFILGIEEVIEASGPRAAYARFYGGGVLILIVRELDDGAKYERVDCTLCSRMGPFFILGPAEAMIGERNLIRKEIKLG